MEIGPPPTGGRDVSDLKTIARTILGDSSALLEAIDVIYRG
jgi:hypothetical protein